MNPPGGALTQDLPDENATRQLAARLAGVLRARKGGAVIELIGELGAGKTTLARALLGTLGHDGPVVSPTYTLMEEYAVAGRRLLHLDLYRIADPEELEYLGWREWQGEADWLLVEWPDRAAGLLPECDLRVALDYDGAARRARLAAVTPTGEAVIRRLEAALAREN